MFFGLIYFGANHDDVKNIYDEVGKIFYLLL